MHYSFEAWSDEPKPRKTPERPDAAAEHTPEFAFSKELQELEKSISMTLAETEAHQQAVKAAQPQKPEAPGAIDLSDPGPHLIQAVRPEALAHAMANEIISTITLPTLEGELAKLRGKTEEYLRDNKVLSSQIRQLLHENEQQARVIAAQEAELNSYRQVAGNLYWKS